MFNFRLRIRAGQINFLPGGGAEKRLCVVYWQCSRVTTSRTDRPRRASYPEMEVPICFFLDNLKFSLLMKLPHTSEASGLIMCSSRLPEYGAQQLLRLRWQTGDNFIDRINKKQQNGLIIENPPEGDDILSIPWDKRGPVAYYIELSFEVAALVVDFVHHLHMLLWANVFLSLASLVIIMQLRCLINEIQRKFKHRNYLWVLNPMEKSCPLATAEDLKQNSDNCAICWEKMETARKLPCSHLFHK
ncbi:uncharacterized protein LOC129747998 [Uranotaenia lowii]|uniref:uncharacterized protein LOC129747998 n=1 Tax=Uranotaenia lowii TaxID=190385 RepID=UPI00247A0634|nr:uncharacterized protein LOC129747998 [Uranotaenia lowii]XP_055598424.1 uncharacterized protein LOC129747998 [Uranotaenia lowii]